jgi:hypothetical protein
MERFGSQNNSQKILFYFLNPPPTFF